MTMIASYNWESDSFTQHTATPARVTFREAVLQVAEKAKAQQEEHNRRGVQEAKPGLMVSTCVCFTRRMGRIMRWPMYRSVQTTMLTYMDIGMVGYSMRCAVSEIAHQRRHNEKDQSYQEARDKQE